MYYPAWAPSFEGLEGLELKDTKGLVDDKFKRKDGTILNGETKEPVTLNDVAPERRWAVDFETGELHNQRDFQDMYLDWIRLESVDGQVRGLDNKYFDPTAEAIPSVADFVLVHPERQNVTWKRCNATDFKPPRVTENNQAIDRLVEGLGEKLSGFAPRGTAPQETRQVAERRPKFEKVPAPSEGDA